MKRILVGVLVAVGGLLALGVVAAVVLAYTLDPNDYRNRIEGLVEGQTGREVAIEGQIGLSYFPWLGAEINRVRLGNAPGFGPEPFARAEAIDVRVRLLPLLWGEVKVGKTVLRGLEVHLAKSGTGRTNWADLVAPGPAGAPPGEPSGKPSPPAEPGAGMGALSLGGLEVRNASLSWVDQQTGREVRIKDLHLTVGALRPGTAFPVEGGFRLSVAPQGVTGEVGISGNLEISKDGRKVRFDGVRLRADLTGEILPGGSIDPRMKATGSLDSGAWSAVLDSASLSAVGLEATLEGEATRLDQGGRFQGRLEGRVTDGERLARALAAGDEPAIPGGALQDVRLASDVTLDLGKGTASLPNLQGKAPGLEVTGKLSVSSLAPASAGKGSLALEVTDGRALASVLEGALPEGLRPAGLTGASLGSELQWDMGPGTARLSGLRAQLGGARVSGSLGLRELGGDPRLEGEIATNEFSPRGLMKTLGIPPPETSDPEALGRTRIDLALAGSAERLDVRRMTAELDQSRLTGTASVGLGTPAKVAFNLELNRLDADRYLPPGAKEKGAASPGTAAAAGAQELPTEPLRDLEAKGQLRVGELKVRGVRMSNLVAHLQGSQGKFRLHPFTADLYGGSYQGDVRLDATGKKPRISLQERLSQVSVGPLLKDLTGRAYLDGRADLSADLAGAGATVAEILQGLSGEGEVRLRNGSVHGIDLSRALSVAYSTLQGGKAEKEGEARTEFRVLKASGRLEKGRLLSRSLSAESDRLGIEGEGAVKLMTGELDYRLDALIKEGSGGLPGALEGLKVPVRITGTLSDPKVRPDLKAALKSRLQQEGKERAGEKLKGLEKRLPKDLREKTKDLLNF